jgi:hypothetical protein
LNGLLCSAFALCIGVFGSVRSGVNNGGPLFVIGLFLALSSALAFQRVNPRLLLAIGLGCTLLGLWFIAIPIYRFGLNPAVPGVLMVILLLGLPMLLIAWGSIGRFRLYGLEAPPRPTPEAQAQAKRLIQGIVSADLKTDNEVVELMLGGPIPRLWRGRLSRDAVLLVSHGNFQALILSRRDFEISSAKPAFRDHLNAEFRMDTKRLRCTLSTESYARYERWKEGK